MDFLYMYLWQRLFPIVSQLPGVQTKLKRIQMLDVSHLWLSVPSFNERISLSTETFKVILGALDQAKARVYGTLCLSSDIRTCSKWWHMTHAAYSAITVFYPVERIVLNEFKCVCSAFLRVISRWIRSLSSTKFACNFKLQ